MTMVSRILSVRRTVSVLIFSALLPITWTLTGCSEAPQLPTNAPQTKQTSGDAPPPPGAQPHEAPVNVGDAEKDDGYLSGGGFPGPADDVQESRIESGQRSEEQLKARELAAQRAAEEEARWRAQREAEARSAAGEADGASDTTSKPKKKKAAAAREAEVPTEPSESYPVESAPEASPPDDIAAAPPPPPPSSFPGASPSQPEPSGSAASSEPSAGGGGSGGGGGGGGGILSRGLGGRIGAAAPPAAEQPKAFDLVPVFYGTDRVVEPNAERLHYGTERGHKLQLGRAMVSVPTAHKVPNIERPWVVEIPYFKYKIYEEKEDPAKHFTMQEIGALTKEQLLAYVKDRLDKSTNFKDHAFVFVHGFNTSFDAAIYRTAQIAYDLKFDGAPFVYSWPSGGKVASYTYDRGSAEQAEPHLAEFLNIVVKESGAKNISLIAHSMGNEILLRVLERMRPAVPEGVVISQVILAAPDVDRDKFSNIARQITDFAKGVTLYAASNDRALGYSARFWGGVPRAGDVPASGPLVVSGVDTIDVTTVSTDSLGLNHSGYAENKTLLNDIGALLQGGIRPPDKRLPSLLKIETAAGPFWRYPKETP